MKKSSKSPIIGSNRSGLQDIWNAFMVGGASFSQNDIPLCPSTAKAIPNRLIGYDAAKTLHRKEIKAGHHDYRVDAFIHFYIDDQKFDGKRNSIWLYPDKALEIICHFSGIIAPDFSTYTDFPEPLKLWNIYRSNAFGYWIGNLGIPVISNARWGSQETWQYCFDGNPHGSIIAIGTVASGIKRLENRPLFEAGLCELIRRLSPQTILIYGSSHYTIFDEISEQGISIISFPSRMDEVFSGRDRDE